VERNQPIVKQPLLFLVACAAGAVVAFGLRSEPSAARPLIGVQIEQYRATLLSDSALFRDIVRSRFLDHDARPQSSITFTNPRLLVTTPKTDALPLDNVEDLSIRTEFVTQRLVTRDAPILRFSIGLRPGTKKLVRAGLPRVVVLTERVTQWNSVVVDRQILNRTLLQRGEPAVIVAAPPRNVAEAMALTGSHKLVAVYSMMATAYTADSAQAIPTGRTATGLPARYGVVAVDPRIIPLGTKLFIEGYGTAIAADTGGDIVGNRIDLCMDSYAAAIDFGRQPVKVYVLRNR
jgi:3D (Asp-Asp-Asp) domain-containing protein